MAQYMIQTMMDNQTNRYKTITWKNWMMLHYIINPGLAINELILGQRVPAVMLEDNDKSLSRLERTKIPCPHCDSLHDSRVWSSHNRTAFRNWFGLYCPNCGGIIPCLRNSLSALILLLAYPVWGWWKDDLKAAWLRKQPERFNDLDLERLPNPYEGKGWIKQGMLWGLFMFVSMTFLWPWIDGSDITIRSIWIGIPIWALGGLGYGYTMKLFFRTQQMKQTTPTSDRRS